MALEITLFILYYIACVAFTVHRWMDDFDVTAWDFLLVLLVFWFVVPLVSLGIFLGSRVLFKARRSK